MTQENKQSTSTQFDLRVNNSVLVLRGQGVKISVKSGHLICEDTFRGINRKGRFNRATCGIQRLVILGYNGFITLDAIDWLTGVGASLMYITRNATLQLVSSPLTNERPELIRLQVLAKENQVGLEIVKNLLSAKISLQAKNLSWLERSKSSGILENLCSRISDCKDVLTGRSIEARAAEIYWGELADVPLNYSRSIIDKIPSHWFVLGNRQSVKVNRSLPRSKNAISPGQAMLNYLYTMLYAECSIACHLVGLDSSLGIVHFDKPYRDSFSLDLIEPVRPLVDRWLISLLSKQIFTDKDFYETISGVVRMSPEFSPLLIETSPLWQDAIHTWIDYVVRALSTNGNNEIPQKDWTPNIKALRYTCKICGNTLSDDRRLCDDCLGVHRFEQVETTFTGGPRKLKALRETGKDPRFSEKAIALRSQTAKTRREEMKRWEDENDDHWDAEIYRRDILPGLDGVSLNTIRHVTGLSLAYCGRIRNGQVIPHPRHWQGLRNINNI